MPSMSYIKRTTFGTSFSQLLINSDSPDMNHTSKELKFCLSGSRGFENCFPVPYKPELVRQRWLHSCVVLSGLDPDTELAKIKINSQGKLQKTAQFKTILDPSKDGKGLMILAQEQDSCGGRFDRKQSFAGMISQFNIFERFIF